VGWKWNADKARKNKRDHDDISFELARHVFEDPFQLSVPDPHPDGDRWNTIGRVGEITLFVVHTDDGDPYEPSGRIISARRATAHERKAYEEGE
jgi:uncharacterized DUF497 family protein